jgi:hypothetical protein
MKHLVLATAIAGLGYVASSFAQSSPDMANAAIAQNFQFMNHPPPPIPASSVASTGGTRGHRHRQASTDSDSTGASPGQP